MEEITIRPIGVVRSPRSELTDDFWGDVISRIELDSTMFGVEVVAGLQDYSHLEVIYHFNQVGEAEIEKGARHPRGRKDWPLVGIFAQRAKGRPNRLGLSRCRLLEVDGLRLKVQGLDAIEGSPVIDVKPYMAEFAPIGTVIQPEWSHEIMQNYYKDGSEK